MSLVDKNFSSDSKQLRQLLRKGRLHLATIPTIIFIAGSLIAFSVGLVFGDLTMIISGAISALILSQCYWGIMSVRWRLSAYQFNYCFTLYREAIKEQLIYPSNHYMNLLLIGHPKDIKAIKNLDSYLLKYKKLPKLESIQQEDSYRSFSFRIAG